MASKRQRSKEGFGIIKSSSITKRFFGMLLVIAVLSAIVWYVNRPIQIPLTTATHLAPEELGGVGVRGSGGDPLLNEKKNRFSAPDSTIDLSVHDIISIPTQPLLSSGARHRSSWNSTATIYLSKEENRGIRVTGYLLKAKKSGKESCNGYSDSLRDYHIWISDSPEFDKASAMIVEMTPRWQAIHPEWKLRSIERLATKHAKVRVTGWLLWDDEHAAEVEKSRATQWEIHPVTNFEVLSENSWKPLADNN